MSDRNIIRIENSRDAFLLQFYSTMASCRWISSIFCPLFAFSSAAAAAATCCLSPLTIHNFTFGGGRKNEGEFIDDNRQLHKTINNKYVIWRAHVNGMRLLLVDSFCGRARSGATEFAIRRSWQRHCGHFVISATERNNN